MMNSCPPLLPSLLSLLTLLSHTSFFLFLELAQSLASALCTSPSIFLGWSPSSSSFLSAFRPQYACLSLKKEFLSTQSKIAWPISPYVLLQCSIFSFPAFLTFSKYIRICFFFCLGSILSCSIWFMRSGAISAVCSMPWILGTSHGVWHRVGM